MLGLFTSIWFLLGWLFSCFIVLGVEKRMKQNEQNSPVRIRNTELFLPVAAVWVTGILIFCTIGVLSYTDISGMRMETTTWAEKDPDSYTFSGGNGSITMKKNKTTYSEVSSSSPVYYSNGVGKFFYSVGIVIAVCYWGRAARRYNKPVKKQEFRDNCSAKRLRKIVLFASRGYCIGAILLFIGLYVNMIDAGIDVVHVFLSSLGMLLFVIGLIVSFFARKKEREVTNEEEEYLKIVERLLTVCQERYSTIWRNCNLSNRRDCNLSKDMVQDIVKRNEEFRCIRGDSRYWRMYQEGRLFSLLGSREQNL